MIVLNRQVICNVNTAHNNGDGGGKKDEQNVSLPWKREALTGQLYLLI